MVWAEGVSQPSPLRVRGGGVLMEEHSPTGYFAS